MEQMASRGFSDRNSFEAELTAHAQVVAQSLTSLGEGLSQTMQQSKSAQHSRSPEQEYSIYTAIQTTVDTMLENSQWLCGPEFVMGINRMCPQWSMHEGSIEQIVHYVQVVESMRETLSGQFQHPQDLAEDLMRSQEVLDYQRTLFGETLRNNGLAWKALGLPAMEGLIQGTQEWVLNLAKTLTIKIRAEVNLALESVHHSKITGIMEEDEEPHVRHAVKDVMELVLQGALLSASCVELVGKQCPMLLTAWMELTSQNCTYSLGKMNELIFRSATKSAALGAMATFGSIHLSNTLPSRHPSTPTGKSRGVYVKTMEIYESMPRLLQCVSEMREEEELDGGALESLGNGYGGGPDEEDIFPGISATSSDQDDAMDLASSSLSSSIGSSYPVLGHPLDNPSHSQQHRPSRPAMQHSQRRLPVDPLLVQRWIAMESLASVLVETGLELCSSLAEILGTGYHPSSSLSGKPSMISSTFSPALVPPFRLASFGTADYAMEHSQDGRQPHHQPHPSADMSSSARARAAIASLTSIAGGGAMVSGTGGVGMIYVQFVVRLLSKIMEFSGQDSHQEQRLLV